VRRTRRLRSQLLSPAAVWGGSQATQPRRSLWEEQGTQDPRWGYLAGTEQVQLQQWSQRFHCAEPALLRCSNTVCTAVHHGCTPETGCQQRCRASVPYWVTGAEAQAALRARSAPQFLVALAPPVTTRRVRALRAAPGRGRRARAELRARPCAAGGRAAARGPEPLRCAAAQGRPSRPPRWHTRKTAAAHTHGDLQPQPASPHLALLCVLQASMGCQACTETVSPYLATSGHCPSNLPRTKKATLNTPQV